MTPLELRAHGAVLAELLAAAEAGELDRVRVLVRLADDLARGLVTEREARAMLRAAEPGSSVRGGSRLPVREAKHAAKSRRER